MSAQGPPNALRPRSRGQATGSSQAGRRQSRAKWALAGITAGALALRLVQLGRPSLWYDETVSVFLAGQPVAQLIAHTARDIHPPGYYLLLRAWQLLTGFPTGRADPSGYQLEFLAAFLSLWFGVLLVPLTWHLARRLQLGRTTALVAALLVAISPFGIWYSQEVRMYTLGATLGLLCILAAVPFAIGSQPTPRLVRATIAYSLVAAAGLYSLYYFAFLLLALNLFLLPLLAWRLARSAGRATDQSVGNPARPLLLWLAAQAGALVLYLPWAPIAWRQATEPPVPPWRVAPQLFSSLVESWNALSFGQSAEPARFWPLLLLTLVLVLIAVAAGLRRTGIPSSAARSTGSPATQASSRISPWLSVMFLSAVAFGPGLLILLVSAVTPVYHVRYLFTYSPAFSILVALGLVTLGKWRRPLGLGLAIAGVGLLLLGATLSLRALWTDPAHAADDHRSAVQELAARWRPGDLILANAGYSYPALMTYWPDALPQFSRLSDYTNSLAQMARQGQVVILQSGHIDGDPDLGWGDPSSDFYSLPAQVMQEKLAEVAQDSHRLWHYRIYDTVNDPQGLIRTELADHWSLVDDRLYNGEANLRVQAWQSPRHGLESGDPSPVAIFDDWLTVSLDPAAVPTTIQAGAALDLPNVLWRHLSGKPSQPAALSLRLVDPSGTVWAAHDEPLGGNQDQLREAGTLVQPLRLWVPAGTAPGPYDLALVVYEQETGMPMLANEADHVVLGQVQVERPADASPQLPAVADFEAIRLLQATTPATTVSPGDDIPLELLWQASSDHRSEALVVVIQLVDAAGEVVASLEEEPLGGRYPTTLWQPGELVRDRHTLAVPADVAPGRYDLIVGLYRAADRERLTTARGPLGLTRKDHFPVREITVGATDWTTD